MWWYKAGYRALAGLPSRNTLICRSSITVSPCPCNTPPARFLSKILINSNPYFHTALTVWICKCLFNAPKTQHPFRAHGFIQGLLKCRRCLAVTILGAWQLHSPKPAKWILGTEDMPQPPSTICLLVGVQSQHRQTAAPDNGENSSASPAPLATRKKKMSAERICKIAANFGCNCYYVSSQLNDHTQ